MSNIAELLRKNVILSYQDIPLILDNLNTPEDIYCPYGIVNYKASDKKDILSVFLMGSAGTKDFVMPGLRVRKTQTYSDFDIWVILKDSCCNKKNIQKLKTKTDKLIKNLKSPHPITFWFISESSYRNWDFIDTMSQDSYLSLAANHLKDYFLSSKTLIAGKETFHHTLENIHPSEGYELSIISLMQAYKGNPGKAALRAALGLLIATDSIKPISVQIEEEAKSIFKDNMSKREMLIAAEKIPTPYEIISSSIIDKQGLFFTPEETTLLTQCYRLKSGMDPEQIRKYLFSKNPNDLTEQKRFIENVLSFITQMQIRLKDRYLHFLRQYNRELVVKKLTDLKIYTRMLLSWESRHLINDLIKNINLQSIFLEQKSDDLFIIQYYYREGLYISSEHIDLIDALSEISKINDCQNYIRFKGSFYQYGYDRKIALSFLKILSEFIYTPSSHPSITSMLDYINMDLPDNILIFQNDAGYGLFYRYPYGRTGRLKSSGNQNCFPDLQALCQLFYEKYFKQGFSNTLTVPSINIMAFNDTSSRKNLNDEEAEFINCINDLLKADGFDSKIKWKMMNEI